jgi:hypothetical protein
MEGGARAVRQDGPGAAGEDGGHPATVLSQVRAPDCVYATVDPMEPAGPGPLRDRGLAQAVKLQLGKGDYPVLALGGFGLPFIAREASRA